MLIKNHSTVPRGGRYSHIRTVQVCAAWKSTIFWPWPLLKTLLFDLGRSQKTPFSKIYNSLIWFSYLGWSKRLVLKKVYASLLLLAPKPPVFPVSGRSESPPIFSEGPLPKPIFKPCAAHIYQFHIWVPPWVLYLFFCLISSQFQHTGSFVSNKFRPRMVRYT